MLSAIKPTFETNFALETALPAIEDLTRAIFKSN